MKKIGVILSNLKQIDQNVFMIDYMNKHSNDYNISLFVNQQEELAHRCLTPVFYMKDAFLYEGIMVATDLFSAECLIKMPSPEKKYFYNWALEWTFFDMPDFERINSIYRGINLLANTEEDSKTLSKVWKTPAETLPKFDILNLLRT